MSRLQRMMDDPKEHVWDLPLVFISGPLTGKDSSVDQNVRTAMAVADVLMELGYPVILPHICQFWAMSTDTAAARKYEAWMELCLTWVARSDIILRLSGRSEGADMEELFGAKIGIKTIHSILELLVWTNEQWRP